MNAMGVFCSLVYKLPSLACCLLLTAFGLFCVRPAEAGCAYGWDPCYCDTSQCPACQAIPCEAPRKHVYLGNGSCVCACVSPGDCGLLSVDDCFANGEEWYRGTDGCCEAHETPSLTFGVVDSSAYYLYDARVDAGLTVAPMKDYEVGPPAWAVSVRIEPEGRVIGQGHLPQDEYVQDLLGVSFLPCDVEPFNAYYGTYTACCDSEPCGTSGTPYLFVRGVRLGPAILNFTDRKDGRSWDCTLPYPTWNCDDYLNLTDTLASFNILAQTITIPPLDNIYEGDSTPIEVTIDPRVPAWQRGNVPFEVEIILPEDGPYGELGDAKLRVPGCAYHALFYLEPCQNKLQFEIAGITKTSTDPLRKLILRVGVGFKIELTPGVWDYAVKAEAEFDVKQGVDLIVPGQTEENEETKVVWIPLNSNYDEDNVNCAGDRVRDNEPHCPDGNYYNSHHRIVDEDNDLRAAQIKFYGVHPMKWSRGNDSSVKMWKWEQDGETGNWVEIIYGDYDAQPGETLDVLLEGHSVASAHDLSVKVRRYGIDECGSAKDKALLGVTRGEIISATLPNGFLAVPDRQLFLDTGCRLDPQTLLPIPEQETENEIQVTYRCIPDGCECADGQSWVELWVEACTDDCGQGTCSWFRKRVDRASVPKPQRQTQTATVNLTIDSIAQTWSLPRYYLKLTSPCGESEEYSGLVAKPLIDSIDFSPRAHLPGGSFCPYTHHHTPILGNDPWNEWYGLTLVFQPNADLEDDLTIEVTGVKQLNWPHSARLVTCNPQILEDCHRIKWEGYDSNVTEDPLFPAAVFPNSEEGSPEHVVAEGEYRYKLQGRSVDNGLSQSHLIARIPIGVEYDIVNPKIPSD